MEWKTKNHGLVDGQRRERLKFAWFPMRREDGNTSWLENVRILEEWHDQLGYNADELHEGWVTLKVYRGEFEIPNRKKVAAK